MVVSMNVTFLLEGIDISTPAPICTRRVLAFSPVALPSHPYLVIGLTTLLPLGLYTHHLLLGARHQCLHLLSSKSLEYLASSYAGLRGP
jgi:hypothetical protein